MWFTFTRVCIIKYPLLPWNWLHRCICFYSYISLWLLPEKRKVIIFSKCTSLFSSVIFWSLCSPSTTPHYCWYVDSNTRRWHKLSTWCSHGKWTRAFIPYSVTTPPAGFHLCVLIPTGFTFAPLLFTLVNLNVINQSNQECKTQLFAVKHSDCSLHLVTHSWLSYSLLCVLSNTGGYF